MVRTYNILLSIMQVESLKKRAQDNKDIKRLNTLVFIEKKNSLKKSFTLNLPGKTNENYQHMDLKKRAMLAWRPDWRFTKISCL